jgi:hypothetical protein
MDTGGLTPKSNNIVAAMRFTGNFGQPDGFGSVLEADVRESGDGCLKMIWRDANNTEHQWSVMLNEQQRVALAGMFSRFLPKHYEVII